MGGKARHVLLLASAAALGLAGSSLGPRSVTAGPVVHVPVPAVSGVETRSKVVALTFDDGPDPKWTPKVLGVLRREHATATFFVLGPFVNRWPGLVRDEVRRGAEVECHGWDHTVQVGRRAPELIATYTRCADAVQHATGRRPVMIRPPYGLLTPIQFKILRRAGFVPVLWDVNALPVGWTARHRLPLDLAETRPGAIVLLHDGRHDRSDVVKLLPELIDGLRARGYRFVTLSQLLSGGPALQEDPGLLERRYCAGASHGITSGCVMPGLTVPTGTPAPPRIARPPAVVVPVAAR